MDVCVNSWYRICNSREAMRLSIDVLINANAEQSVQSGKDDHPYSTLHVPNSMPSTKAMDAPI